MNAKLAKRTTERGKTTLLQRSCQFAGLFVFPATHQRKTAPMGRQNIAPSYGRLFARTEIPTPSAIAAATLGLRRILPRPPKASAPPMAAGAPPQKEFTQ